jgi:hypothetical protein
LMRIGVIALLCLLANAADVKRVGAIEPTAADAKPAGGVESADVKQVDAAELSHATVNPLAVLSLSQLSATRDRPLFSASRRPPAPTGIPVEPAPVPLPPPLLLPPAIALTGTVSTPRGLFAVIRTANNKSLRVTIGHYIDGWKVSQIDNLRLTLSRDSQLANFALFKAFAPPVAGSNVAPVRNPGEEMAPAPGLDPATNRAQIEKRWARRLLLP